jgi:hypothetical protein
MKKYQDGSPMRSTMKPSTKTGPGYKPAQGAPKVTITPKAKKGGSVKKYEDGGMTGFEKRQAKKVGRAETRAAVANIEGEGTVAQKRDNRAERVSTMAGTARTKTPKSVSTSTSTSTSTVNNNESPRTTKSPQDSMKTTGKTTKPVTPNKPMGPVSKTPDYPKMQKSGGKKPMMKTGGMVNSNTKVTASKAAKGKVGGISKAPKTAIPKAKYGMSMRKK